MLLAPIWTNELTGFDHDGEIDQERWPDWSRFNHDDAVSRCQNGGKQSVRVDEERDSEDGVDGRPATLGREYVDSHQPTNRANQGARGPRGAIGATAEGQ